MARLNEPWDRRVLDREVGDKLRAKRVEKGLTRSELAQLTGVHCSSIGRWERGEYGISVAYREILAKTLGVTCDELTWPVLLNLDLLRETLSPLTIGQRLKFLREGRGYTLVELANLAGVRAEMIADYERKSEVVYCRAETYATFESLSKVLKVPTDVICSMAPQTEADVLRARRVSVGLTLRQLSALSGVPYSTISSWERKGDVKRYNQKLVQILEDMKGELQNGRNDGHRDVAEAVATR